MNSRSLFVSALVCAATATGFAQSNRISARIDTSKTSALLGHVRPEANTANDQGQVDSGFQLPYMTLIFAPSAAQKAQLDQLLADQQNPASPRYHQWLTPEQYADQFGLSTADMAQVVSWLQSQGFTVDPVSRSRTFVTFTGNAGQVQNAFGTTIHHYKVNGQMHYANASDLTIPEALSPLVSTVRGLNDFHPKAKLAKAAKPQWTLGRGNYVLAPDDFATIYDLTPLYSSSYNGTGVKVAVVGQSEVKTSDITGFWSQFGITTAKLTPVLINSRDNPGIQSQTGDVDESSLDLEWGGAVNRGGTMVFVYSLDVWDSALYAVDNVSGSVLSMSYGECEMYDLADLPSYRQAVQQANAEGMTWLAAAGDSGATDCDADVSVAEGGLAVDEPGSIPEVTSMGGTALSASASYWNTGNTTTDESAKGYMPEIGWNETAEAGQILGTGGGASMYFPQPQWQTTGGVPADGWRHVPDLAFNASVYAVPYYVYCTACTDAQNGVEYVGGTSAATPTMAGVVAIINQYLGAGGLGNINPTIYSMYQNNPAAFHNNITGNNIEPCAYGSPGCVDSVEGYSIGGSGYSSVVGFGSIDVNQFVESFKKSQPGGPVVVASLDQNPVYQGSAENCGNGSTWNFMLTLSEEGGFATTVTGLTINGNSYTSQIAKIFGTSAIGARQSITGCVSLSGLSAPTNVLFNVSGPNWNTTLSVSFQGPQTQLSVGGATNAASYAQTYAPGMLLAVFGTGLGTLSQAAATLPLPEYMAGVEAYMCPVSCATSSTAYPVPLWYVGPNQVNLQIPYEVSGAVDLNIGNPYTLTDFYFTVSSVAPGIFVLPDGSNLLNPSSTASPGATTFLFITGDGRVSPALADGTSPAAGTPTSRLPKPVAGTPTVTVGGVPCTVDFYGISPGLVGVTQVNFTIPTTVPTGLQPVVVTVGTVSTQTAYINIQ